MIDGEKYLVPIVVTRRALSRSVDGVAGFCRKFRFHRFAAIAADIEAAREMVLAWVSSDQFRGEYAIGEGRVGVTLLFPQGDDLSPINEGANVYLHVGVSRDGEGRRVGRRTLVCSTSPGMAEWRSREAMMRESVAGMILTPRPDFEASFVVAADGDLISLGQVEQAEAAIVFRETYVALAHESGAVEGDFGRLAERLDDDVMRKFAGQSRSDVAMAWALRESGEETARKIGGAKLDETAEELLASFLTRMTPGLFRTHSHEVVGVGESRMSAKLFAAARGADLLAGATK